MIVAIQTTLLLAALALAVRWAEWPERMAAATILGAIALDRFYHWAVPGSGEYSQIDLGHLTIDLYLLAGFLAIALKADRQWCLWASAAQVVTLLGHPVRVISGNVAELAYAVMIRALSWLQIALIFGGIAFVALRRRQPQRSAPRWPRSQATAPERWPSG